MFPRPYRLFVVILSCAILFLLVQGVMLAQEDPDPTPQFRDDIPTEESPGESTDQTNLIEGPDAATAVVKDGSFENNPSGWEQFNQTPCPRIGNFKSQTGVAAKDGNKYLWVGGKCNGQPMGVNNAHQEIDIPSKDPVLTFYYYMERSDPDGASPTSDLAYVRLNGKDVWTKPMTRANNTNGWVKETVDLGAFAGLTRTLKMSGRNEDEPAGGHIYYDLVSVGSGTAPQEPVLTTKKFIVDDDKINDSYGDNDGIAECGETIELVITVENRGSAAANDFYMTVATSDPYAMLLFNPRAPQSGTEKIVAGGTYINNHPHDFDFAIASNTPAGRDIRFDLTMRASNGGPWEKSIVVPITCGSGAPPPVPTLNAIDNGDKDGDYYVTWNKVNGATKYWLEEEKDNSGNWNRVHYASSNNPYLSGRNNGRYCYRVRSENGNGFSGWSGEKCTTVDTYIVPPQLTAPANNSTITDTTPTFDWMAVGGAYEYQLQVDNNSGFGSPAIDIKRRNTQSSNYTPSSPLSPGTYYWRMRTYKNGTWSSWTNPAWKFTISAGKPGIPTLYNINNDDKDGNYTVDWSAVNTATSYRLEEKKDGGSWHGAYSGSNTQKSFSGKADGRYCYRVLARNSSGDSNWSGEKCTTVDTYIVPPQLTAPGNNSTITDTTPTFDWVAVGGAYEYQLQVDNNSGFGSPEINITRRNTQSSNYTPSSPLNPGTYYWRMRTYKNGTWSSWTNPAWKFTISAGKPGIPTLYNINNDDKDGSYTVDWSFVNTATSYQLDEKKDGGSWHGVYYDSATKKSFSGKADGRYCYRVLARNSSGDSDWSGEKCAIVDTYIVPPQLTKPANNSTIKDKTPTFDWVAVGGAYEYHLQVDNDSGFGSPEIDIKQRNTQNSSYTPSSELSPDTYYWRMRTYKNGKWSEWTEPTWKFTISGGRPEMDVRYHNNGQSIADGDAIPSVNDGTDFGSVDTNGGSVIHIFKIFNTGDGNLDLIGSPTAKLTGCDGFSMVELPDSPVVPGGSRVFSVEFDPTSTGDCTATLSIANNDVDESPYNFAIGGKGKRVADVSITHIEVTQGIQNLANDMPLVADRRTAFRVYVRSDNGEVDSVCKVKVYTYLGGRFLGSKDAANDGKVKIYESKAADQYGGDRWRIDNSFWGLLPTNALAGNIRLRAELYCGDALEDKNLTNNIKEETVTFQKGDQLKLHFVSPYLKNKSGQTSIYRASGSGFYHVINNLYRFHPIASFSFTADPETVRNNGGTWNLSTKFNENRLVDRIALMNLFDGKSDTYWMGLIAQDVTTVRGGLAMVTSSWSKMNVDGRPKYPWSVYGGSTVAHELGHNKGLDHVDCDGTEDDTDNNYPWTNPCRLAETDPNGFYGFDVYYDLWNLGAPTVITNNRNSVFPHNAFPMMGYKQPRWISPYEYCKLLKKYGIICDMKFSSSTLLDSSQALDAGTDKQLEKLWFEREAVDQALVFTGFYDQTNASAVLLNTFVLEELPPGTLDAYRKQTATDSTNAIGLRAIGLSSSGKIITEREIVASTVPGSDNDLYYYQEILPFSSEIATLRIVTKDQTLATATASHNAPVVELLFPNGGERLEVGTVVKWNANDADGDALSFILQYSPDGGDSWQLVASDIREQQYTIESLVNIPGSIRGLMRVIASDGFYAPQDTSDDYFTVPDSPPVVHIYQPLDGGLFEPGKTLILFGSAYDSEDGPLSGTNLEWFSDKDGELGQGSEVHIDNISAGQHSITLRAMDSIGKTTSATASIYVGYRILLPNVISK